MALSAGQISDNEVSSSDKIVVRVNRCPVACGQHVEQSTWSPCAPNASGRSGQRRTQTV